MSLHNQKKKKIINGNKTSDKKIASGNLMAINANPVSGQTQSSQRMINIKQQQKQNRKQNQ